MVGIVRRHPDGISLGEIVAARDAGTPQRTLQYRLRQLVDAGLIVQQGQRRWTRYLPLGVEDRQHRPEEAETTEAITVPVSAGGAEIRRYLRTPPTARTPVGYNRDFPDAPRPNPRHHLSPAPRQHLSTVGPPPPAHHPSGTAL